MLGFADHPVVKFMQKFGGTQVEEQVATQQSYSPKGQRTCWECKHCTVSWAWQRRFLLVRLLSQQPCVSPGKFMMSIIWMCLARRGKLSETVCICNFNELWKWTTQFSALANSFCSLELKGIMLIYTSHWSALGIWLQTSSGFLTDRNKHARLFSVLNLVTLPKLSTDLVCPIWSISRIAVMFSVGADF